MGGGGSLIGEPGRGIEVAAIGLRYPQRERVCQGLLDPTHDRPHRRVGLGCRLRRRLGRTNRLGLPARCMFGVRATHGSFPDPDLPGIRRLTGPRSSTYGTIARTNATVTACSGRNCPKATNW